MHQKPEDAEYAPLITTILTELKKLKSKMETMERKLKDVENHVFQLSYRAKGPKS